MIGLYAATNPARSGPYLSRKWCVDRYDAGGAALSSADPPRVLPWTRKIEREAVMDLVGVADVVAEAR